ncbi:hypothetical protein FZW96_15505 [Bacillus sp. BGMRC 2118]|nr:hypothetical protein FZW96_15505 [Bacillus sp. BGMRC 2118]
MKKYLGIVSFVLFLIAASSYITIFIDIDELLLSAVICSCCGLVLSLLAKKGQYKKIALLGNITIIIIALVLPFVATTLFWNTP